MKALVLFFCLLSSTLLATSVRLYNDSPYKLRAIVRGADGSYLGEMILLPQTTNIWNDTYSQFGPSGEKVMGPNVSQTPYFIQWYCLNGEVYSVCTNIATGALVTASRCEGDHLCKPAPPINPNTGVGEELQEQNAVPENPYLPNSPYNPENPNNPITPNSPYSPNSPYNPNNPESPYNPKNPKSPYYKPSPGPTGTIPPTP